MKCAVIGVRIIPPSCKGDEEVNIRSSAPADRSATPRVVSASLWASIARILLDNEVSCQARIFCRPRWICSVYLALESAISEAMLRAAQPRKVRNDAMSSMTIDAEMKYWLFMILRRICHNAARDLKPCIAELVRTTLVDRDR